MPTDRGVMSITSTSLSFMTPAKIAAAKHHSECSHKARAPTQHKQCAGDLQLDGSSCCTLKSCTMSHCFIRVDTLVELLAIEEILNELPDLGDSCGPTDLSTHRVLDAHAITRVRA